MHTTPLFCCVRSSLPARVRPSGSRVGAVHRPDVRGRGAAGFSLVEVLISVALVSTLVLALVTGLLTLVRTTESNNQRQQIQLALGNMSEGMSAIGYRDCGGGGANAMSYEADYYGLPSNWTPARAGRPDMTAEVLDVEYWNPATKAFQDTCQGTDGGAQQLTLRVTWRDREDTTQVVIRR